MGDESKDGKDLPKVFCDVEVEMLPDDFGSCSKR